MEPLLGQILLFAGDFAPRGWAVCQGQLLDINTNQALFSILGTRYGGDGIHTFALPDLRGQVISNELYDIYSEHKSDALFTKENGVSSSRTTMNYIISLKGLYPSKS